MDRAAQGRLQGVTDLGDRRLLVGMQSLGPTAASLWGGGAGVVAAGGASAMLELTH